MLVILFRIADHKKNNKLTFNFLKNSEVNQNN